MPRRCKVFCFFLAALMACAGLAACGTLKAEPSPASSQGDAPHASSLPDAAVSIGSGGDLESAPPVDGDAEQGTRVSFTAMGDNRIRVEIEEDRLLELLGAGRAGGVPLYGHFLSGETQKLSMVLDAFGWSFYPIDITRNTPPPWEARGQWPSGGLTENRVQFDVMQEGIRQQLEGCEHFVLLVQEPDKDVATFLSSGALAQVYRAERAEEGVEIVFKGTDEMILRLHGRVFDELLYETEAHSLAIQFHHPDRGVHTPNVKLDLGVYGGLLAASMNLFTYEQKTNDSGGIEIIGRHVDLGDRSRTTVLRTETGHSIQVRYQGVSELLDACESIAVVDQNKNVLLKESMQQATRVTQPEIPPLPSRFPTDPRDAELFRPATDDYLVVWVEMPLSTVLEFNFGYDNGRKVWGPVDSHEAPMQYLSIISYDEFGIAEQRTKLIHESTRDAIKAPASRLDGMDAALLTGDEARDEAARLDFFGKLDQKMYGSSMEHRATHYAYLGREENFRYFVAGIGEINILYNSPPLLDYDRMSLFDADGFLLEELPYWYDFPNFKRALSEIRNATARVTVYHSKAGKR